MNRENVAYCAGLFEGEGTVGTYIRRPTEYLHENGRYYTYKSRSKIQLKIAMTDSSPLYIFADTFDRGSLLGPYKIRHTVHGKKVEETGYKDRYHFEAWGFQGVQYIMAIIWPWLSLRRKEQYKKAVKIYLDFKRGGQV